MAALADLAENDDDGAEGTWSPAGSQEILLVRHGRPATEARRAIGSRDYARWLARYDKVGVDPASQPSPELRAQVDTPATICTSELPRAVESARRLAPSAEPTAEPLFTEAELPVPPIPLLRMRPAAWSTLARLLWLAGYSGGVESRTRFEQRMAAALATLEARSQRDGRAVLVAHGWLNWRLAKALKRRGWRLAHSETGRYWGLHRLVRPAPELSQQPPDLWLTPPPLNLVEAPSAGADGDDTGAELDSEGDEPPRIR